MQSDVPLHLRGLVLSVMFMVALRICGIIPMVSLGNMLLWKGQTLYQPKAGAHAVKLG